jgi:hypothetical protein
MSSLVNVTHEPITIVIQPGHCGSDHIKFSYNRKRAKSREKDGCEGDEKLMILSHRVIRPSIVSFTGQYLR